MKLSSSLPDNLKGCISDLRPEAGLDEVFVQLDVYALAEDMRDLVESLHEKSEKEGDYLHFNCRSAHTWRLQQATVVEGAAAYRTHCRGPCP